MGLREQRVIGSDTDVHAGAIHRAALTNQDVAREHVLAAEFLDAETLGMRIAAVSSAAARFFMCHEVSPATLIDELGDDLRDLHIGVGLPMGLLTLVVLAAAEFDNAYLVTLAMTLDGRDHLGRTHVGAPMVTEDPAPTSST